jgi:hypothetical protein
VISSFLLLSVRTCFLFVRTLAMFSGGRGRHRRRGGVLEIASLWSLPEIRCGVSAEERHIRLSSVGSCRCRSSRQNRTGCRSGCHIGCRRRRVSARRRHRQMGFGCRAGCRWDTHPCWTFFASWGSCHLRIRNRIRVRIRIRTRTESESRYWMKPAVSCRWENLKHVVIQVLIHAYPTVAHSCEY